MVNPLAVGKKDTTIATSLSNAKRTYFEKDLYPADIIEEALKSHQTPACIFKPDRKIVRSLIDAIVRRDTDETFDAFLLRLGLLDKPNDHI